MSREYLNGIDKFHGDQATNEPYILASQAEQVWYVLDSIEPDWQVVVKMSQRGLYDMHSNDPQVEPYLSQQLEENIGHRDEDISWVREGEDPSIITALREVYKNKKYLPLDMCPKKTRAIRRRLTKRRVIRPFILRRKKDEVEKFLPGKTQMVMAVFAYIYPQSLISPRNLSVDRIWTR